MTTYYVKGSGAKVSLTDKHFIAKGGEKSVYALGGVAYCVYHDPKAAIPAEKIRELSVLDRPEIVRPIAELLDDKKQHCGETMPFVSDSCAPNDSTIAPLVLCQLFTNSFRRKHGITNDHVVKITDSILSIVHYCHKQGVVLVDPNETNWLVKSSLDSVFLIDTSCSQTASYPGTAIKPAIRDWNAKRFTPESDYFSVAVVLAWLWVGIHPYLAHHKEWEHLDANTAMEPRMRKHASFFDNKTEFNRACRPIAEIPAALKSWLISVLQDGRRYRAPQSCGDVSVVIVAPAPAHISSTQHVSITEIERFQKDIVGVFGSTVVYELGTVVGYTPLKGTAITARVKNGMLDINNNVQVTCRAKAVLESDGRIYAVSASSVNEVVFNEVATIRATVKHVGTIADMPTTKVFPGCVVQNVLGRYLLSIFPESGKCIQHQLRELESWQILDAKYERGVFSAMAETGGKYKLCRYRIDGSTIDYAVVSDQLGDVNFAVTASGVCVMLDPNGELVAFRAKPNVPGEKRFSFPAADMSLFARGPHVVGAIGSVLYRVGLA